MPLVSFLKQTCIQFLFTFLSTAHYRPNAGVSTVISKFAAAAQIGVAPGAGAAGTMVITDDERKKILEEEQKQLDLLKVCRNIC